MTNRTTTQFSKRAEEPASYWAIGAILFATVMMLMAGTFQIVAGVAALFENEFYLTTPNYVFEFDATTWGWIHILVGAVLALAGIGVMQGNLAARIVGIALAALSAVTNFMFIPYYPFWSVAIIALDVLVIWALAAHGRAAVE